MRATCPDVAFHSLHHGLADAHLEANMHRGRHAQGPLFLVNVDQGAGFYPSYRIGRGKRADGFSPRI